MKKKIQTLIVFITIYNFQSLNSKAQILSPQVIASAGGNFTTVGSTLSWTMGETFNTSLSSGTNMLTQGFQQPLFPFIFLKLRAFFEGYYLGNGQMQSLLYNLYPNNHGVNDCDSIIVELHETIQPFNIVATSYTVLQTNGNGICKLPLSMIGGSFYISLRHRNCIETWSKLPVLMKENTSYQFTTFASMAFGNNQKETIDHMGWAIFSGDITQDKTIDATDFLILDPVIQNGNGGYLTEDLNGDGSVDATDFLILDPNIQNGVGSQRP